MAEPSPPNTATHNLSASSLNEKHQTEISTLLPANVDPPDIFIPGVHRGIDKIMQQQRASTLGSSGGLRALTTMTSHAKGSSSSVPYSRAHGSPAFTTSPTLSEPDSPKPMRPQTPTPSLKVKSRAQLRSSSHPGTPRSVKSSPHIAGTPHPHGKPSVKHLTCFWWKEKGDCRFKEEDCLYSHYDTGLYADAPRQVMPGEAAVAGRSLDRALRKLHLSSSSLNASVVANASSPDTPRSASVSGIPKTPSTTDFGGLPNSDSTALRSDNAFLRNLVDSNTKEKAVLVTTVESLQTENKALKDELIVIKSDFENLRRERGVLRDVVNRMQHTSVMQNSNTNPYGAIGAPASVSWETAELQSQNKELRDMLRNYGHSL